MARSDQSGQQEESAADLRSEPRREGPSIFDYQLKEKIGEGSFGTVWKAERDGMFVALKELNKSLDSKETQDELKSLEALKKLHHKSLLHTENSWTETGRLYIEMELADGGSLKDRLKAYKATGKIGIPEDELLKFFTETAQAVDYLHRQTPVMLHRDIKPGNILLVSGCAKIADFGLLRQVTGDKSATRTQGGTLLYLAPESIANDLASVHTDLWSFAVTYVELRQGTLPFTGKSIGQIYDRIRWEPPELSDIFDPEEKKVILKALDKEPKNRHTSCYDFVFQLNRVVPWTPALKIPVMEPAADPATGGTTPRAMPTGPAGITSKPNPGPTRPDIQLPPMLGTGTPTPPTDRRLGATEKVPPRPDRTEHKSAGSTATAVPPAKPMEVSQPAQTTMRKPEPLPSLISRRRRRSLARAVGGMFLVTLISGLAAVIWLVASSNAEQQVDAAIKKGDFPAALKTIDTTPAFLLSASENLRDEVQTKWWNELKSATSSDLEGQREFLKKLEAFEKAFPKYDGIKARRDAGLAVLRAAVAADVDRLLKLRNISAAEDVVKSNEGDLEDHGRNLRVKIDRKQERLAALERAGERLRRKNDFEGCLAELAAAKAPFDYQADAADVEKKQTLLKQANDGKKLRDESDANAVKELKLLAADPKYLVVIQLKLKKLYKFRSNYAKADWSPTNSELVRDYDPHFGVRIQLAEAWEALEAGDTKKCRDKVATVASQLKQLPKSADFNPTSYSREQSLLETLANVWDSEPAQHGSAFKSLIEQVREQGNEPPLASRVWTFVAQLDKEKKCFSFNEIDVLENIYGGLSKVERSISAANSQLLARYLERTNAKIKNDAWLPRQDECAKIATWFTRIEPPLSDYLQALKTECLLESGAKLEAIDQAAFPLKAEWYGDYVHALVEQKKAVASKSVEQYAKAAELLLPVLQERSRFGPERTSRAIALLRGAIKSARGDGQVWPDKDRARDAIRWLEAMLKLVQPTVDDLLDLAFAAVKTGDIAILEKASQQMETAGFDAAAKRRGHLGLAQAYIKKGNSNEKVVNYLEKTLAVKVVGKDPLRADVDKEIKGVAEQLTRSAHWKDRIVTKEEAIAMSALCERLVLKWRDAGLGDEVEAAADLYAEAVYNRAYATAVSKFETTDTVNLRGEIFRICKAGMSAPETPEGFYLPLIEKKLKFAYAKSSPDKKLKFADAVMNLDEAIAEGEAAVQRGEKIAETRMGQKKWWYKRTCQALVALGEAKERWIQTAANEEYKVIADNDTYVASMIGAAAHYRRAIDLDEHPDSWVPHYKLGGAYALCNEAKPNPAHAAIAKTQLIFAQKAIEAMPEALRKLNQRYLNDIKTRLKSL